MYVAILPDSFLQQDADADHCRGCRREFTILLRHHKCRFCGIQTCDDCSNLKIDLGGNGAHRACRRCYEKHHNTVHTETEVKGGIYAIGRMISYKVTNVRIITDYPKGQQDELAILREIYKRAYDVDAPELALSSPSLDYYGSELENMLTPLASEHLLTPHVNGILSTLLTFTRAHLARVASYTNDPASLWTLTLCARCRELLGDTPEGEELRGIDRIKLISNLLEEETKKGVITTDSVTVYNDSFRCASETIARCLEGMVRLLQSVLDDRTLGDELSAVANWGNAFLDRAFQTVAKIADPTSPACTIFSFFNAIHSTSISKWLNSSDVAQLLMAMSCSEPVSQLFGGMKPPLAVALLSSGSEGAQSKREAAVLQHDRLSAYLAKTASPPEDASTLTVIPDKCTYAANALVSTERLLLTFSDLTICLEDSAYITKLVGEIRVSRSPEARLIVNGLLSGLQTTRKQILGKLDELQILLNREKSMLVSYLSALMDTANEMSQCEGRAQSCFREDHQVKRANEAMRRLLSLGNAVASIAQRSNLPDKEGVLNAVSALSSWLVEETSSTVLALPSQPRVESCVIATGSTPVALASALPHGVVVAFRNEIYFYAIKDSSDTHLVTAPDSSNIWRIQCHFVPNEMLALAYMTSTSVVLKFFDSSLSPNAALTKEISNMKFFDVVSPTSPVMFLVVEQFGAPATKSTWNVVEVDLSKGGRELTILSANTDLMWGSWCIRNKNDVYHFAARPVTNSSDQQAVLVLACILKTPTNDLVIATWTRCQSQWRLRHLRLANVEMPSTIREPRLSAGLQLGFVTEKRAIVIIDLVKGGFQQFPDEGGKWIAECCDDKFIVWCAKPDAPGSHIAFVNCDGVVSTHALQAPAITDCFSFGSPPTTLCSVAGNGVITLCDISKKDPLSLECVDDESPSAAVTALPANNKPQSICPAFQTAERLGKSSCSNCACKKTLKNCNFCGKYYCTDCASKQVILGDKRVICGFCVIEANRYGVATQQATK